MSSILRKIISSHSDLESRQTNERADKETNKATTAVQESYTSLFPMFIQAEGKEVGQEENFIYSRQNELVSVTYSLARPRN